VVCYYDKYYAPLIKQRLVIVVEMKSIQNGQNEKNCNLLQDNPLLHKGQIIGIVGMFSEKKLQPHSLRCLVSSVVTFPKKLVCFMISASFCH
jgi:hypothetical protein